MVGFYFLTPTLGNKELLPTAQQGLGPTAWSTCGRWSCVFLPNTQAGHGSLFLIELLSSLLHWDVTLPTPRGLTITGIRPRMKLQETFLHCFKLAMCNSISDLYTELTGKTPNKNCSWGTCDAHRCRICYTGLGKNNQKTSRDAQTAWKNVLIK